MYFTCKAPLLIRYSLDETTYASQDFDSARTHRPFYSAPHVPAFFCTGDALQIDAPTTSPWRIRLKARVGRADQTTWICTQKYV